MCLCKFKDYFLKGATCHTEHSEVSIKSKRGYFANAQYDNDLFAIFLPCHTEHSEVSTNLSVFKRAFKSFSAKLLNFKAKFSQTTLSCKLIKFIVSSR